MNLARRIAIASSLLVALSAAAFQVARQHAAPPTLAAMLPQGALLTIESPDFSALLHDWNTSPEQHAWLASANYSEFQNSRLFGRLSDAQDQFFKLAFGQSAPAGTDLLTQVAGRQSIFAWYDIGNLEFIYITRMPSAQSLQTSLLKARSSFGRRQQGSETSYIRTSKDTPTRTVAFAQVGDLLILATREDLMAGALALVDKTDGADSVSQEPWFTEASAALPAQSPVLHMVLNLDRIVPMPYFRSYWVQQNITEMKQYRAAVADLYRETANGAPEFREERALLLRTPDPAAAPKQLALSGLSALAASPDSTSGTFRAVLTADPAVAVEAVQTKLLGRGAKAATQQEAAPDASIGVTLQGSVSDLETRIDDPAPLAASASSDGLRDALNKTGLDAVLTVSTASLPASDASLWVPIRSAVVLRGSSPWDPATVEGALDRMLRGSLTTGTLGIEFHRSTSGSQAVYAIAGARPLFFAPVSTPALGNLLILTNSEALLTELLKATAQPVAEDSRPESVIAGFDHASQRAPYARLTSLIDATNSAPAGADTPAAPAYFSGNLRSLSDAFASLRSERLVERRDNLTVRQTVTYQWQRP